MSEIGSWMLRLVSLACGIAIGFEAFLHYADGLALDAALPVPSFMIAGIAQPKASYAGAALALGGADRSNGDAQIARAEAAMYSGISGAREISDLRDGLTKAPASTRGWLLLAQASGPTNRSQAATALSQALILAPYDYWVAGKRARMAALLWADLDSDTRQRALDQVRLLWEDPQLHEQVLALLSSNEGTQLVTRAFAGRRDELVALNRWVSARHRSALSP